ncbi:hypothetical protein SK128_012933 [Halocaridina rubra]|uniref:Uncharacterized protein n=1 Tax=Halocaridina rubra TaxID=373956 RepID=A0AAN8WKB4_HALRR
MAQFSVRQTSSPICFNVGVSEAIYVVDRIRVFAFHMAMEAIATFINRMWLANIWCRSRHWT